MSELIVPTKSWQSIGGVPLLNGKVYIGLVGMDPVANPKNIFSDRELATPLANPVPLDSFGNPTSKIWLEGRYSIKVDDSSGSQVFLELDNGEEPGATTTLLTNVQGSNAITADASPAITALSDNAEFSFEVVIENDTDAVTLAVGTTGAKAIKRNFDQVVGKGKFKVGDKIKLIYNEGEDNFRWANENARVIFTTQGADIPSAATVDLSVATGNKIDVTGHTGPITSFGTVLAGVEYELTFPGSSPVTITSSSIANPTNILCGAVHGLTTGDETIIDSHVGSVPDIDGRHTVTVVDTLNYTIPVNVTTGGTGGTSTGVPKITHHATSNILPGGADIEVEPGDVMRGHSLGSGNFTWNEYHSPLLLGQVASQAEAEAGTQATKVMTALRTDQTIENRIVGGIAQGDLKSTTGEMSTALASVLITGPGGEYGFWPNIKSSSAGAVNGFVAPWSHEDSLGGIVTITPGTSYINGFHLGQNSAATIYAQQRYVQASPPYDMGDGEVHSFIFAIVNNGSGLIESTYHAADPPWANNGPTNIRPDRIDLKTGKKYKTIRTLKTGKASLMAPDFITETEIEVTAEFKNSDMGLIPHPFLGNDLTGKTVVMLDPMSPIVERLESIKNAGGDAGEILRGNFLNIDNSELNRGRPSGVMSVAVSMK